MIHYLQPEDLDIYKTIRFEALATDPDAFGETLAKAEARTDEEWVQWFARTIVPERKHVICIKAEDHPVAMCGFGFSDDNPNFAYLWGMYVSPAHRKSGLGRLLLAEATGWAKSQALQKIEACVAAPNDAAIQFYRNHGFTIGPVSGTLRPGSEIPTYPIEKNL